MLLYLLALCADIKARIKVLSAFIGGSVKNVFSFPNPLTIEPLG